MEESEKGGDREEQAAWEQPTEAAGMGVFLLCLWSSCIFAEGSSLDCVCETPGEGVAMQSTPELGWVESDVSFRFLHGTWLDLGFKDMSVTDPECCSTTSWYGYGTCRVSSMPPSCSN